MEALFQELIIGKKLTFHQARAFTVVRFNDTSALHLQQHQTHPTVKEASHEDDFSTAS
jgi:hypothetical protein